MVVGVHVQLQRTIVKVVVKRSRSVYWPTKMIDWVSVYGSDLVVANAEEPFDTFSKRLSAICHIVALAATVLGSSVGNTAGATVVVVGYGIPMVVLII